MPSWAVIAWLVIAAYVVVGNYLYFAKVLPVLRTAGLSGLPRALPSAQIKQFRQAAAVLEGRGERRWFFPLMRRFGEITCVVLGFVTLVVVWGLAEG